MNDIIVFGVGLFVSTLVAFGLFSRVPMAMQDAEDTAKAKMKSKNERLKT